MSDIIAFSEMHPSLQDHHIKKFPAMSFTVEDYKQIKALVEAEPTSPKKLIALRELNQLKGFLEMAENTMGLSETIYDFRQLME
jgi:hypothetical protein